MMPVGVNESFKNFTFFILIFSKTKRRREAKPTMNQRSIRLQRCSRRWQKKKLINYGIICFVVPAIDEEESFFLQFMTQADDDAVRRPCRERKKKGIKNGKSECSVQ